MSSGWSVGLDIGGTKVDGVLLDATSSVRGTLRAATVRGTDGVVACASQVVRELAAAAGIDTADLTGVGVGVPGLVDPRTGSVSHAVNLGMDLSDVPLGAFLATALDGVTVRVENDVNAAALGAAHLLGLGADLAYLALGTGVAVGVVLDGRLRRGYRGGAGEIGHVPYEPAGPLCACGQRGCLELYASGSTLDAAWPVGPGLRASHEVFEAAAAGDPRAVGVRDAFVEAVAAAVRLVVLTYDVERVVLGGGVAEVGEPLLDAVRAVLRRQADVSGLLRSLAIADRVLLAPTGAPVAAVGAALAVRSSV
ncbi:sugar kinase [Cellulomonas sp. WB94]|uniref:ROK family protein n=1 Tax=Cellulomonas sp. WB94 TaxID=2173174 RepID=UPI000D577F18|nr:ROK family protein [Cellulomonas sp. WB94]PVU82192.1 sugar kinase [Cellulomonas sp. WB94]